jgi:hypothetical protein
MRQLRVKIAPTCGALDFRDSLDLEALQQVRRSNMDRAAIKNFIYGGVEELLNDKKFYHHSSVGSD